MSHLSQFSADIYITRAFKAGDTKFPIDESGMFQFANIAVEDTWKAMEKLLSAGKVKAIGVSNFNIRKLQDLLGKSSVVPAVNQVEMHPYLQQPDLIDFCKSRGILIEAYSPLGNNQVNKPRVVDDSRIQVLAKNIGMDPAQVLYSWAVQRGTIVLPKSVTPHRIESNLQVKELPAESFKELNNIEQHARFNASTHWGVDIFDEIGDVKATQLGRAAGASNLQKFG